jgi:putative oxidoreductase
MAGAYWLIHYSKMGGGWPINNDGDAAVLFCFLFLYIAAKGSGIWSVDGKRS